MTDEEWREREKERLRREIRRIEALIAELEAEIAEYERWVQLYNMAKGSLAAALALINQGKSDFNSSLQALIDAYAGERAKKLYRKGEGAQKKMNDGTKNAHKIKETIDQEISKFNSEISSRKSKIGSYKDSIRGMRRQLAGL